MVGTIKFWNAERQFGFAATEDGQEEFFITAARFTRPAGARGRLHWIDMEGRKIQFDRATNNQDVWTRKLYDGKLKDEGIDSRNPRPARRPQEKPVATNVVVIDPDDPGGVS